MTALTISGKMETMQQDFNSALFNRFVDFIDRGEKTTRTYLTNLKQFMAWMKYSAVIRPERADIIKYRDWLTVEHDAIRLAPGTENGWEYRVDKNGNPQKVFCKANTILQYLRSVKQFFAWTASENLYPDIAANVHAPKVRHDTHKKEALTADEVLTIEKSIERTSAARYNDATIAKKDVAGRMQRTDEQGKRLFAMYQLAVNAGLRTVEMSRANVKDVEIKNGRAYIYIWGKGHTEADTKKALAPEVAEAIKDYLQSRSDEPTGFSPLFVATGNRSGGKRIDPTTISKMLKKAMKKAGFDSERITTHSLRHTAGTNVQEITRDLYQTQKYMRHANPTTTAIYLHNATDEVQGDIADRLYRHYHSGFDRNSKDLSNIILRMNPAQITQLTNIAAALA
ncbi:MAG: tyrosine-type recombinase/integrase [Lachnospiraceae bacterium]|nr:tyrosine-type recombinase/integrase [Lachnospiraceae bacterium]